MPRSCKGRKPTIGLFVSELENAYAFNLCKGVTDAAEKRGANVIVFPGKTPNTPYEYQYQFNIIYELPDKNNIDALILATGTMINFLSADAFKSFYGRYKGIPLVSISIPLEGIPSVLIDNKIGLRKAVLHLIDHHKFRNIAFIKGPESNAEAAERFSVYTETLMEHGIPFNPDLVCEGDFTQYSAIHAVERLLDENKVQFDAIVAANDEMALSAMSALNKRGIRVPQDVAIVGFDNVESAEFSNPALTTVAQPIYEQAKEAFNTALAMIDHKEVGNTILATDVVIRESCGCISQSVQSINLFDQKKLTVKSQRNKFAALIDSFTGTSLDCKKITEFIEAIQTVTGDPRSENLCGSMLGKLNEIMISENINNNDILLCHNLITDLRNTLLPGITNPDSRCKMEDFFHQARVLLTELVMKSDSRKWSVHHSDVQGLRVVLNLLVSNIYNREEALSNIIPQMKEMGIKSCSIYLYKNSMHHSITDSWQFPKTIIHSMGYGPENIWNGLKRSDLFSAHKILDRNFLPKDRRYTLVVAPLFYMDEQLGFIVCEIEMTDAYLFESLVVEISCALKLTYLMKSRQDIEERLRFALEELEEYNKRLSSISQTDELTGLLNRRGFMNQSRLSLSLVRKHKKNGVLFFADLDGLKRINDSYGHEEGDFALRTIAVILQKAFRETDIIARLGGDEFTVFTINTSVNMIQRFQNRINSLLEEHNNVSGKPYRLSTSIGAVPFSANGIENIESLLNQADILLYKQKTARKLQKLEEVKVK